MKCYQMSLLMKHENSLLTQETAICLPWLEWEMLQCWQYVVPKVLINAE
jgi:hypothetical protein